MYGLNRSSYARLGHLWIQVCWIGNDKDNEVFLLGTSGRSEFPDYFNALFKRRFFNRAVCLSCASPMEEIAFKRLSVFKKDKEYCDYVVCSCGHPVWRLVFGRLADAEAALVKAEYARRRKEALAAAGGSHTLKEIQQILTVQKNRCIYCNKEFIGNLRPSKDHLLAVSAGGPEWALNIVISCISCNSRRGSMPFRTFCKLLSPSQNRRILTNLERRLLLLFPQNLSKELLESFSFFEKALLMHDSKHFAYLDIQKRSPEARRNVKINRLLPRNATTILSKLQD